MTSHVLYLVLRNASPSRYWRKAHIARSTRKTPVLKQGEVAIKLDIGIPDDIFEPPTVPIVISEKNIIRPKPAVTAQ